jgi:ArsR family transcriptional regulator, lead/cadmium/zinc/bismuth-responsive transcriptional repressor
MRERDYFATAETIKLLSDPTRLKIVVALLEAEGELCVQEIAEAVGVSHSATSHQLAKLEDRGVVRSWRDGHTMCYELTRSQISQTLSRMIRCALPV